MDRLGIWKEFDMMQMPFYAFMTILVSLIIIIGFGLSLKDNINTVQLENGIAEYRLFNSPDCFILSDNNGFLVRGTIDLERLNEDNLNKCLHYSDGKMLGLKLTLKDFDGNSIKEVELNKQLTSQRISCGHNDDYICYSDRKYVLYKNNDIMENGFLDIVMVRENDK